jgi:hypothetical protein
MPWFIALVGVLALALTTEIAGYAGSNPRGSLVGVLDGEHTVVTPVVQARIALALDARLPAAVSRPALEEVEAIWAPYGVMIASAEAAAPCPLPEDLDAVLTVHIEETTAGIGVWSGPFASIRFLDGVPETTIRLHYRNLMRLGLASLVIDGAHEAQWPRTLRDRILARMIGRVVAHEIGHWLLRTRGHSATGLMRAVQGVGELADPSRVGFRLDSENVVRLRETVAR